MKKGQRTSVAPQKPEKKESQSRSSSNKKRGKERRKDRRVKTQVAFGAYQQKRGAKKSREGKARHRLEKWPGQEESNLDAGIRKKNPENTCKTA